jgi:hypothetical protein
MWRWATVIVHVLFTVSTAVFVLLESQTIIFISMMCCIHASYKEAQFYDSVWNATSPRTSMSTHNTWLWRVACWSVPSCLSLFSIDIWALTHIYVVLKVVKSMTSSELVMSRQIFFENFQLNLFHVGKHSDPLRSIDKLTV